MAEHHYVPKFYLKKFCDPNTPEGQEPYVWVAPKSGGEWKRRAPKNTGFETDLYSVTTKDEKKSDEIEKLLSAVESRVARLYRDRLDRFEMPTTEDERVILTEFVALFVARSPFARTTLTQMADQMGGMFRKMLASRPEVLERNMREFAEKKGEELKISTEDMVRAIRGDTVKWNVNQEFITQLSMTQLTKFSEVIFNMNWRFLVAPYGEYFVTTDSPAYWQDLTPRPAFFRGHGLAMTNVEVVLPLSRKLCFLARWERSSGVMVATVGQVREIINRTIAWSIQEVFSPHPFKRKPMDKWKSQPLYPFMPEKTPEKTDSEFDNLDQETPQN